MKRNDINRQKSSLSPSDNEKPEVYAVKRGKQGWKLNRRSFLASAVAAGAALTGAGIAKKKSPEEQIFRPGTTSDIKCEEVMAHLGRIDDMVISPDGELLVTGSNDRIKFWSLGLVALEESIDSKKSEVSTIEISPDGKWLLSGGLDKTVMVWSLKKRKGQLRLKLRKIFKKHNNRIEGIVITPDSKYAVSTSYDGIIMLWTLPKCKLIKRWSAKDYLHCLALSPDGKHLGSGGSKSIKLWSIEKGHEGNLLKEIVKKSRGFIKALEFSPNGKRLASASEQDSMLRIWSIPSGKLNKVFQAQSPWVEAIAISPDGKYIASGYENTKIHSFPSGKLIKKFGNVSTSVLDNVSSLIFTHDSKQLVVGYRDGRVKLWEFRIGEQVHCLIDLEATPNDKYGTTYKYQDEKGRWVEITVPACKCAPPMPKGSVCTCNTVPGRYCGCEGYCSCESFHYWYPN